MGEWGRTLLPSAEKVGGRRSFSSGNVSAGTTPGATGIAAPSVGVTLGGP